MLKSVLKNLDRTSYNERNSNPSSFRNSSGSPSEKGKKRARIAKNKSDELNYVEGLFLLQKMYNISTDEILETLNVLYFSIQSN